MLKNEDLTITKIFNAVPIIVLKINSNRLTINSTFIKLICFHKRKKMFLKICLCKKLIFIFNK